jgi:hypothetical protein
VVLLYYYGIIPDSTPSTAAEGTTAAGGATQLMLELLPLLELLLLLEMLLEMLLLLLKVLLLELLMLLKGPFLRLLLGVLLPLLLLTPLLLLALDTHLLPDPFCSEPDHGSTAPFSLPQLLISTDSAPQCPPSTCACPQAMTH